jgi:hypothetical protein
MDKGGVTMEAIKLLKSTISDYPRLWQHNRTMIDKNGKKQSFQIESGSIENLMDFQAWIIKSSHKASDTIGVELPTYVKQTMGGPCPVVLSRLDWLVKNWYTLALKNRKLSDSLSNDLTKWHARVGVGQFQTHTYTYHAELTCKRCLNFSVVSREDTFICIDVKCQDPISKDWFSWQAS